MPLNANQISISIPLSIVEPADCGRIIREIALINEHLYQAKVRDQDQKVEVKTSKALGDLLSDRSMDITNEDHRRSLTTFLTNIQREAPVMHISFGSEPTPEFIEKITKWCRGELHPTILLVIGLDRTIGVGAIVRTANKVFDFSLQERLKERLPMLRKRIIESTEVVKTHA